MVGVQTLLQASMNMSLRSACFNDEVFPHKKQNVQSWDYSQVLGYQNFQIIKCWINRIFLCLNALLHIIFMCVCVCVCLDYLHCI